MEWLPFPGDDSAASMILAIDRGQDRRLYALDLDPKPSSFEPPLTIDDDARLIALMFRQPLEDLGLEDGTLEPAPLPNQKLEALRIDASYVAALGRGMAAWTTLDEIDTSLLEFPVPRLDTGCLEFEQQILMKHPGTVQHFIVPLPDGEALAGFDTTVVHVSAEGMIAETATLAELASATRTSTAIFVLGDALYRVSVSPLRFDRVADFPRSMRQPEWMSAGTHHEIFGLTRAGEFVRFDGRSWTELDAILIEGNDISKGGALWLGPGEGAVANPSSNSISRWDGSLHQDFVEMDSFGFGASVLSASFGPVVVDVRWGNFYRYEPTAAWLSLPVLGGAPQVQALTDFRDGLAWGTATGLVGYATDRYNCPSEPVLDASEVFELAPLGEGLIAGYTDRNTDYVLIYFRPTEK